MSDHIFTATVDHSGLASASSVSSYPTFVAPYAGYFEKIYIATRTAAVADAGSVATGEVSIRLKNERSGNYLNAAKNLVGAGTLSALSILLTASELEFRKGDIITLNQTVSAVSGANSGPGVVAITFHTRTSRYGGSITQSYSPQDQ